MSIQVENVTKFYGTQQALKGITFTVNKGEIVGFLGPNGAGKSTLMKIMTTYIEPTSGSVKVNGFDVLSAAKEVQKSVGYLPEHNPLYLDLYVREYLEFQASIYNVEKSRIMEVIKLTGLTSESHKKIGQLSKGYRQRVGLASALLHNPDVLILDEPTTGLDPNQLLEIRDVIKNIGKDKTVFLSTHIMQEVEAICDRVIIINEGNLVTDKKLEKLVTEETEQIIEVAFDTTVTANLFETLPNLKETQELENNTWQLTFTATEDCRTLVFDFAQSNQLKIILLQLKSKNLETIFREKTSKN